MTTGQSSHIRTQALSPVRAVKRNEPVYEARVNSLLLKYNAVADLGFWKRGSGSGGLL